MAEDLYAILGVPKSADAATIKRAYRKLAKELHPDKNANDKAAEARFKSVNHANEVLSNVERRKLYDEFGEEGLREGFDADRQRAYKNWSSQDVRSGGRSGRVREGTVNLEDLFEGNPNAGGGIGDVFGDLFGRSGGRRTRGPMPGSDVESEITVDFMSAIHGATLEISQAGGAKVTVRVPPGAAEGSRVRIAGQGATTPMGGPRGDLILVIHVTPHPHFRREKDDLHLELPLALHEAYFGAKIRVPTIDGSVTLKVPERTQGGTVMRVRGKGVERKGHPRGDLYVHFQLRMPTGSEPDLTAIFQKLADSQKDDPRADIKIEG